jgi:antitoxin MazE
MKTQIIQIGNSQGVRIPKVFLEECGITGEVELEMHDAGILIRNASRPRAGWDAAFKAMAEHEDDEAISASTTARFDQKEWQW